MIVLNRIARGGGENVAVQLANQFSRMGHTVFFVSNKERNNISDFYPIEEKVQILIEQKKELFDEVMDGATAQGAPSRLTIDDLRSLIE